MRTVWMRYICSSTPPFIPYIYIYALPPCTLKRGSPSKPDAGRSPQDVNSASKRRYFRSFVFLGSQGTLLELRCYGIHPQRTKMPHKEERYVIKRSYHRAQSPTCHGTEFGVRFGPRSPDSVHSPHPFFRSDLLLPSAPAH